MSSAQTQKIAKGKYRPEIDGLRAFAVVAVIINHFNKNILPGGYLGVDIFFVISGYVITSSLYGRSSKDFKDFISGFYERRIKRLVPALSVFVLIMSIAICLFDPSPGTTLKTGLTSLFGLSNLYLLKHSTDYFAQSTELNVFTHTWSLGVEEQFYILFPFLIWFSGFGRQTQNGARNLFLIVIALTIASLIGFLYLYPTNQPAAYFLMPSRFWEMAAGCLVFIGFQKRASIEQFLEKVPPLLVIGLIIGVMYLPMSMASASTIAVVALSSVLIACLKRQTAAFKVFTNPKVVYIGLISYSLYLWHWGVLSISRWTIGIHWWSVPFQISLMLGLAIASYRWVESPLRKGNWCGKRWATLLTGASALVFVSFGVVTVSKSRGILYLGNKALVDAKNYSEKNLWNHEYCKTFRLWDKKVSEKDFKKCWVGSQKEFNSRTDIPSTTVFAYGNSYNEQLVPVYHDIGKDSGDYVFNAYFSSGCTASAILIPGNERIKGYCRSVFTKYLNWVKETAQDGDIFLIANSLSTFYPLQSGNEAIRLDIDSNTTLTSKEALEVYISELDNLSKELSKKGVSLLILSSIPVLKADPLVCNNWYSQLNSGCPRGHEAIDQQKSQNSLTASNALNSGIRTKPVHYHYADIHSPLTALIATSPNPYDYFYNESHLSRSGAKMLKRTILESLTQAQFALLKR